MAIRFPQVGELFLDRYEVECVLGAGGMARVYGATQKGIERKVAIKVLAFAGMDSLSDADLDVVARRFEREAQIVAKLRSPHTMVMYDFGRVDELLYMILEFVEGTTLHELVHSQGAISEDRVAGIARQSLASLAEAHELGILHRDIKPANMMVFEHLGNPDYVKVLDFGIAKVMEPKTKETQLTAEQAIIGTPSYMSPEQILAGKLEPSSDIYSLGLVLYELLFGVVAVEAESNFSTLAHHLSPNPIEIPDDGRISPQMRAIVSRMIAKRPEDRYQSALELLDEFEDVFGPQPTGQRTRVGTESERIVATPAETIPPPANKKLYATASVLVVAVIAAAAVAIWLIASMMDEDVEASTVPTAVVEQPVEVPEPAEPAVIAEPEVVEEAPVEEAAVEEPVEVEPEEPIQAKAAARSTQRAAPKVAKLPEPEVVVEEEAVVAEPAAIPEPKKFEPVARPVEAPAAPSEDEAREKEEAAKKEAARKAAAQKTAPAPEPKKKKKKAPAVYSF